MMKIYGLPLESRIPRQYMRISLQISKNIRRNERVGVARYA